VHLGQCISGCEHEHTTNTMLDSAESIHAPCSILGNHGAENPSKQLSFPKPQSTLQTQCVFK